MFIWEQKKKSVKILEHLLFIYLRNKETQQTKM